LMDAHELAAAALRKVDSTRPAASHQVAAKVASRARPNATGVDIDMDTVTNNETVDSHVDTHERSRPSPASRMMSRSGTRPDVQQNNTASFLQTTSSDNSQSTTDGHDTASTPPTSTSDGFSSQSTSQDGPSSQLSQLSQLAAAQEPLGDSSSARPNISIIPTAGHKRTADGHVKAPSPDRPQLRGHSRNTSAVSSVSSAPSSKIGEVRLGKFLRSTSTDHSQLSSELRTRLSYAMLKVNNGWQSNTIEEVESLASQAGSPTSSTSTLHGRRNLITSPRAAIANLQAHTSGLVQVNHAHTGDFDLYPRNDQPSRTYESFWRDHSTTSFPAQRLSTHAPRASPPLSKALAPPADIRPTPSSRRSDTPKFSKPPPIPGHGSNSPYHASTPRTPHRGDVRENAVIQTPTQKTIQEQDAIETLLFMSSPGNSGNMGHTFPPPPRIQGSPQQSPLRTEFNVPPRSAPGRRVEFERAATSGSGGSSEAGGAEYRSKIKGKAVLRDQARREAIDRLLDETGDSSSDEEELVLNYASPRRLAAGRV
jgi:hypothetical protein